MSDIFMELRQKAAMKPLLEAKLNELYSQRRVFESEMINIREAYYEELQEVSRWSGKSLEVYFLKVIGKLDEKLDQQRKEAYAAKVKLDAAEQELRGIDRDISELRSQIAEAWSAEHQLEEELKKKSTLLKTGGTETGKAILEIEDKLAQLDAEKREIQEAISAGRSARGTADRILGELEDAKGWNTWDMIGGGGIITHMAKHSHLDEAQDLVSELQSKLRRFKTELADIRINSNMQVNVDGFLRFADYFFDGLFADWAVGDRINQSMGSVSSTRRQICRTLDTLREMEKAVDREIASLRQQLDELIVKA